MAWGDAAAEQHEKDQPSEHNFTYAQAMAAAEKELEYYAENGCTRPTVVYGDDYGPTYAEKVLDADERRGD